MQFIKMGSIGRRKVGVGEDEEIMGDDDFEVSMEHSGGMYKDIKLMGLELRRKAQT